VGNFLLFLYAIFFIIIGLFMQTRDSERLGVAILLFDDVEVLDFAGPFEVFSVTAELNGYKHLHVFTLAEEQRTIITRNGLSVIPSHSFADAPKPDIIVIPGGIGSKIAMTRPAVIEWLQAHAPHAEVIMSVCTGARILAKAGLLDGLTATTHHEAFADMRELAPNTTWVEGDWQDTRFVENGRIITAGGISAGIDTALHVVAKLLGRDKARATAEYMEYETTLL
jgi:transcriptional regulator GlxA family with amidase domain